MARSCDPSAAFLLAATPPSSAPPLSTVTDVAMTQHN
jgi:hypothetical protein